MGYRGQGPSPVRRKVLMPEDHKDHPSYRPWKFHGIRGWSCKHCGGMFRGQAALFEHLKQMGVWPK